MTTAALGIGIEPPVRKHDVTWFGKSGHSWTFWRIRFSKDGNWFKWRLGKEFWVVETFLKLFPERRSLRLKLPALSGWCSSLHQHHFQPPIFSSASSMQIGELWGIEIGVKKIWNGLSWMKKGSCGKLVYAELMWWKAEAYVGLRGKEQGPANLRRIRVRKSRIIAIGSCIQKCFQAKWRKMSWP